jgi:hypothetical protein
MSPSRWNDICGNIALEPKLCKFTISNGQKCDAHHPKGIVIGLNAVGVNVTGMQANVTNIHYVENTFHRAAEHRHQSARN